MEMRLRSRIGLLVAAVVCVGVAALSFTGVILAGDSVGRIIFGIVWVALGIVWLGSCFGVFSSHSQGSHGSDAT